jgi:CDP-diacylglycerol--glycerol-3-phosphate 3-phosphatidyltransferase
VITAARIAAAPLVAILIIQPRPALRLCAFVLFVVAAVSDLWDGYLARSRGQVTPFGKMFDPIADKFLLLATLIPLYLLTSNDLGLAGLPIFGPIPLWVVLILIGRELLITLLRLVAARRGQVVSARRLGKRKAVAQNIFIGAAILWVSFRTPGSPPAHSWNWFSEFHGWFTAAFLVAALALTVISAAFYLATFSRIFASEHP